MTAFHRTAGRLAVGVIWVALAGCGGGGGASPPPSVTADTSQLTATAPVIDNSIANLTINLTAANAPAAGLEVFGSTTENGVSTLSPGIFSRTAAQVQVFLKPPNTLAPGTYHDTVTLQVCTDASCATQAVGSPIVVAVSYTITAVTGPTAPSLAVTTDSVSLQRLATDAAPAPGEYYVGAGVTNAPSYALTVQFSATTIGLEPTPPLTLGPPSGGISAGDAYLTFRSPAALGPGLYADTITISVCLDAACVNPIAGSPAVINVSYLIGNSIPGAGGDTVTQLPLHANGLVWDSHRAVLYASVAADSATAPDSIAVIDPTTGTVASTVALGGEAGRLAISDDGTYLYAVALNTNTVWRLALPSLSLDATLDLGAGFYAVDIAVAPGEPQTIAISRSTTPPQTSLNSDGVVVVDGITPRSNIAGSGALGGTAQLDFLAWGPTASTLYADDAFTSGQTLTVLSVAASGPQITASEPSLTSGAIHALNGSIYTDAGLVVNPGIGRVVGKLSFPSDYLYGPLSVGLDAAVPRIYALTMNGANAVLGIFDQGSLALLRTQTLLGTAASLYPTAPTPLIPWGSSGIAFASADGQVVIVSGSYLTN